MLASAAASFSGTCPMGRRPMERFGRPRFVEVGSAHSYAGVAMRVISTAVAALVIAGAATASPAKDGGGPPKIDIEKTCRENVGALSTTLGSEIRQDTNICMTDERDARDQLVKNWSSYPALAKEQ